jgi:hypothetical protein
MGAGHLVRERPSGGEDGAASFRFPPAYRVLVAIHTAVGGNRMTNLAIQDPALARVEADIDSDRPKSQIFISYRDRDEPFGAALIDHELSARFGADAVFRDARSIRPGEDYVNALIEGVRRSAVLLVVMGPRWSLSAGIGWPADLVDWVRLEIAEAFRHHVRVVPVLLGIDPPSEPELPADIALLARCQYVRIRHRYSAHDISHLAQELAALMPGPQTSGSTCDSWSNDHGNQAAEEPAKALIVSRHPALLSRSGHTCPLFPDGRLRRGVHRRTR